MSIYLVELSKWFPVTSEQYDTCSMIVSTSRCYACNKKARYKSAIGFHALPWGYSSDVYCSWKCVDSGKVYKPDKRQKRRLKRWAKNYKTNMLEVALNLS